MTAVPKKTSKKKTKRQTNTSPAATVSSDEDLTPKWQADYLLNLRLAGARIPARYEKKNFMSFSPDGNVRNKGVGKKKRQLLEAILQEADLFLHEFDPSKGEQKGLFMKGVVGCGKTHIAVAILKEVIAKGFTGLYYNMVDLLSDIRSTYGNNTSISEQELLDEIQAPDLLVLDDLGAEKTTEWVNDRLYLIIHRRYDSGKPILVTTNLGLDELAEKVGERTVSRICEMCDMFKSPFPDEDYRKAQMK